MEQIPVATEVREGEGSEELHGTVAVLGVEVFG